MTVREQQTIGRVIQMVEDVIHLNVDGQLWVFFWDEKQGRPPSAGKLIRVTHIGMQATWWVAIGGD